MASPRSKRNGTVEPGWGSMSMFRGGHQGTHWRKRLFRGGIILTAAFFRFRLSSLLPVSLCHSSTGSLSHYIAWVHYDPFHYVRPAYCGRWQNAPLNSQVVPYRMRICQPGSEVPGLGPACHTCRHVCTMKWVMCHEYMR